MSRSPDSAEVTYDLPANWRPLPAVGARIKLDCGPNTGPNSWPCAGVVLAIADGFAMLVRRWSPRRRGYVYEIIDRIAWHVRAEHYKELDA